MHNVRPVEALDTTEFRRLMSLFTTGVCVVAVNGDDGAISAMTVNSFVSVSLDPMLVCWSLQNASSQFDLYAGAPRFAVSILGASQAGLAARYASRGDSQLIESDFVRSEQGLPVIAGAIGYLDCSRWSTYEAGDHTMIFGEVLGLSDDRPDEQQAQPLTFFDGQFSRIDR